MPFTATDPIKIIFAILLPPVGVFLEVGFKGHFWLNILLTLLGYIPGIIHALYVIFKHCGRPAASQRRQPAGHRLTDLHR